MRFILILSLLIPGYFFVVFSNSLSNPKSKNVKTIQVFENSTKTWQGAEALFYENEIYLPMHFLEKYLGLVRKELSNDQVGICLKEICIPFAKSQGDHSIQIYQNQEFVPIEPLFKALNGVCILDLEKSEMLLNLQKSHVETGTFSSSMVDFTLTDLEGRAVSLSDYRGKKVIVFAWASW